MESIVKVPSVTGDIDFLAFSFNGLHSWDDFGIIRTSDGNRYNDNLMPTMQDKTAEVPGGDGMYYFGTTHKQKDFNISFAFDNMSETTYRKMKQWLNGKDLGDLWFSEAPYKVYTAKPTGTPNIKSLCFEIEGQRVYKGEGSIQFIAYWPYAHTPDIIQKNSFDFPVRGETIAIDISSRYFHAVAPHGSTIGLWDNSAKQTYWMTEEGNTGKFHVNLGKEVRITGISASNIRLYLYTSKTEDGAWTFHPRYQKNGKDFNSYSDFTNGPQWQATSGLIIGGVKCQGENPGDIPATFTLICQDSTTINTNTTFKVGAFSITTQVAAKGLQWDSKTGIVSALVTSNGVTKRQPIPHTGNSLGTIPVDGITAAELNLNGGTLKYHYWYY